MSQCSLHHLVWLKRQMGGRYISSVNMHAAQFCFTKEFHLRAGDALRPIDPLVINLNTPATSLTPWKFEFDLDQDGKPENISFVNEGSGLLALDLNEDGSINDGGELFGPSTGNGFNELAQYDLDGNHWIDENDPIFDRLRIWTRNEAGEEHLLALGVRSWCYLLQRPLLYLRMYPIKLTVRFNARAFFSGKWVPGICAV